MTLIRPTGLPPAFVDARVGTESVGGSRKFARYLPFWA